MEVSESQAFEVVGDEGEIFGWRFGGGEVDEVKE
jgi:hypothetical protein